MKINGHGVNVREIILKLPDKQSEFSNLEDPKGIQQAWNTTLVKSFKPPHINKTSTGIC